MQPLARCVVALSSGAAHLKLNEKKSEEAATERHVLMKRVLVQDKKNCGGSTRCKAQAACVTISRASPSSCYFFSVWHGSDKDGFCRDFFQQFFAVAVVVLPGSRSRITTARRNVVTHP